MNDLDILVYVLVGIGALVAIGAALTVIWLLFDEKIAAFFKKNKKE